MRPLTLLARAEAPRPVGVVFDLDDTALDHGRLTEPALAALYRARAAGLRLVAATGRPAGWAEVFARVLPIDGAVAENGAVAYYRDGARVRSTEPEGRGPAREALLPLAAELCAAFGCRLADDNGLRRSDVTVDVGETERVPPETVAAMGRWASERGLRTTVSSVHLHLTRSPDDKASGVLRFLGERFGDDPSSARARYAFVGDSGNDAACFAAFPLSVGVANVAPYLPRLSVPPRYVAREERGRGFAEALDAFLALSPAG
ncbi:MAG TPA: HAD hydrolase family protein [Polyangiaceae bacterium]|nr:HAD hydrolase family protein [Polyangiaceae bacterium]